MPLQILSIDSYHVESLSFKYVNEVSNAMGRRDIKILSLCNSVKNISQNKTLKYNKCYQSKVKFTIP